MGNLEGIGCKIIKTNEFVIYDKLFAQFLIYIRKPSADNLRFYGDYLVQYNLCKGLRLPWTKTFTSQISNFFPADDKHSRINIPALIGRHFTGAKNGALFRSFLYMCYFFEKVFPCLLPLAKTNECSSMIYLLYVSIDTKLIREIIFCGLFWLLNKTQLKSF